MLMIYLYLESCDDFDYSFFDGGNHELIGFHVRYLSTSIFKRDGLCLPSNLKSYDDCPFAKLFFQ